MSDDQQPATDRPGRSFGGVAVAYDRGRPSYPRELVARLTGPRPLSVLELGAGTGKLTEQLVALGHDVHATDPDRRMLDVLARRLPDVRTSQAPAEEIPAGDREHDLVVAGQAFHWFDHARALPEIARVTRPGGRLALLWNSRDERIPWVKRLGRVMGEVGDHDDWAEVLAASGLFGEPELDTERFWQVIDRDSVRDLALSRSAIAALPEAEREARLTEVVAFYDDYGRGMDGMQLPWTSHALTAEVVAPQAEPEPLREQEIDLSEPVASDGTDTELLLIDFR
ncbi:class I SAM-dependent methyltransferase [Nocardioides sp. SYSU D00038]|uniref:class I SAM-dependent methyltransferase n=1 Tax=Nocardioides sp. SYSU D00038 TaxID=2812554 RepID=UPI0019681A51|nr:class I SAM-dependent methyltransferase [Nocardioides sp. SYSU D00038]